MGRKICFVFVEILGVLLILNLKTYLGNPYLILVLLAISIFVGFFYPKYFLASYILFLLVLLLFREKIQDIGEYHTKKWLTIIFKNKTVFINVLGNIFLFIPLGFALKRYVLLGICFSIIIELLQRILDKGVFDYLDIALNILGTLIGFMIWELYVWMIKRKTKKKLMNSSMN